MCYIDKSANLLVMIPGMMSYMEALTFLGATSSIADMDRTYGKNNWDIYTKERTDAKALAIAVGATKAAEVHGDGYYGHYHDKNHKYHIFFGEPISYSNK